RTNHNLCRNLYNRLGKIGSFPPKSNHGTLKTITVEEFGILIRTNNHLWDSENPHPVKGRYFQCEFKVNICSGAISNFVIGPFELPPNLTGPRYLNCPQYHLNELLKDVPLALRENVVRQYLYKHCRHRWIGRGNEFVWPPRCPNLNPLYFSVWPNFKDLVYQEEVNSLRELRQRIQQAVNTFKNNRYILFNIQRHLRRCILKCIDVGGGHFLNLI
ncbi:hypothetical protein NQ318_008719, partial [Aromia moschata]